MAATMLIPSQQGSPPLVEGSENLSFQRLDRRGEVEMGETCEACNVATTTELPSG